MSISIGFVNRLFDKYVCLVIYERCLEDPTAVILSWDKQPTKKYKPLPLNTIEMQKLVSRILKMSSAKTMKIAEKLYNKGYISYPRTETNKYNKSFNLKDLVKKHTDNPKWGDYVNKLVNEGWWDQPREGKSDDQAHPPIHPVKSASKEDLDDDEWRIYELITKHFLATVSKDAVGKKTVIEWKIKDEIFTANGVTVEHLNYLEIYTYEKWSDCYIPEFK